MVDGCQHSFSALAEITLPTHMAQMRRAIAKPIPMRTFSTNTKAAALRHLNVAADFSGCYVLLEGTTPIYVGISRSVVARLIQHVRGRTHYDASLAYRIASVRQPHAKARSEAMKDAAFIAEFNTAKAYLVSLDVAFIEVACPVELYLFEVYCALELKTAQWNSFRTH